MTVHSSKKYLVTFQVTGGFIIHNRVNHKEFFTYQFPFDKENSEKEKECEFVECPLIRL
jgi:hypothetical protein